MRRLNVVALGFGSSGDVLPFVGMGAELRRRGHDVTVVCNPYFAPQVDEAGLALRPVGTVAAYHELMADADAFDWRTYHERLKAHFVRLAEPVYEAVASLHQPGRTVLLAAQPGAWAAPGTPRIPLVCAVLTPTRLQSRHDPPYPSRPLPAWSARVAQTRIGLRVFRGLQGELRRRSSARRSAPAVPSPASAVLEAINRVRARLDMPAIASVEEWISAPARTLCMWPEWFSSRQPDWPARAVIAGFPFDAPAAGESAEPARPAGDGRRPLVFTTGSVACRQQAFFAAAAEACRILERPGVLVTPHADQIPRPLPAEVTHLAHAPFRELFARAALVVHHGGIGTIALALAAGVPQIVRPMVGEQFDLGNRVQRLGVGRLVTGEGPAPAPLARMIAALLRSPRVAERCRHWQAQVDTHQGLARAADAVEGLADADLIG